ncbi:MAG: hypothetical protein LBQ32_13345 [Burkholderiaceae bacterium]|jgi:tetratricopeptide (TPR) repeat protein|nr:hypothetical protein [Burkholderiaceae bacterium]
MTLRIIVAVFFCIALSSCAINERTAHRYANAGEAASQRGDWTAAREHWRRAVINAKLAHMNNRALAVAHYEYGRASGVVCEWTEAEFGLKEAYRLDAAGGGPAYMAAYELGRMYYDRKQYGNAADQFARVKVDFDRLQADTKDPVGYADFLDEYAIALEQTGKAREAQPLRARSSELRKVFSGRAARTEKTPYGTQCKNP